MKNEDRTWGMTREEVMRLVDLLDLSECAMFTAKQDPGFEVLYANKRFYSMLQYTPQEFEEQFHNHFMEVLLPEEKQRVKLLIARQSVAGGSLHLEFRVVKKDGSVRWMSMTAESVKADGQPLYYCSCMDITEQKRSIAEIYDAKKEVDLITNSVPGGVVKVRMSDFKLLYANDGFYRLSGYSRTEYISLFENRFGQVIFPDDLEMVHRMIHVAVENRGALGLEYRIIAKSGEVRWAYVNGCRVDDQDGSVVYLCVIMDITSRKILEEKFADNARRSKYLLEYMQQREWTYRINEQKMSQSGYLVECNSIGLEEEMNFSEESLRSFVHPDDVERLLEKFRERSKAVSRGKGIYRIKDETGNYQNAEVGMISVSSDGSGIPDIIYGQTHMLVDDSYKLQVKPMPAKTVLSGKMFSMAKEASAKYEDSITELLPYEKFIETVEQRLEERSEDAHYGILCCDVNGSQRLAYHYGISVRNEMLHNVAMGLLENISVDGLCSRISGDYFVSFFRYNKHSELAKKISQMLKRQMDWEEGQSFSTHGVTCGIYLIPPEEHDLETMFERADLARRSIKGLKGSHYAIYTEELEKSRFWEEEVLRGIDEAMEEHSIEIIYLPRIRGDKENVIGCKAIPRVQIKNGDYISLEDLHRYIDRSEAVQQMVFYVLSNVCSNMSAWRAHGKMLLPVSLDITPGQLCLQNAVKKIDEIVKAEGLEPHNFIFEIQESYFSDVTINLQMAIEDLSRRGYRVFISHFGANHTAVHSLRELPITGIKFHGEFFKCNIKDEREQVILRKIVEMARELDMAVGCGGITTKLQEDFARSIGCDILEGERYYGAVHNDIYEKCFLTEE